MIDLRAARNDPDGFRAALARKGAEELFDALLEADAAWRDATVRRDEARARQKKLGKPSTPEQIEQAKALKAELQALDAELVDRRGKRQELLDRVPNPPDPSAPDGWTDEDAEELRRVGEPRDFGFEPLEHDELGARLGWLDMERGARASGARFAYRLARGRAARARALPLRARPARRERASSRCCRPCSSASRRCTAPASCRPTT